MGNFIPVSFVELSLFESTRTIPLLLDVGPNMKTVLLVLKIKMLHMKKRRT
jgi:hypothetical protein